MKDLTDDDLARLEALHATATKGVRWPLRAPEKEFAPVRDAAGRCFVGACDPKEGAWIVAAAALQPRLVNEINVLRQRLVRSEARVSDLLETQAALVAQRDDLRAVVTDLQVLLDELHDAAEDVILGRIEYGPMAEGRVVRLQKACSQARIARGVPPSSRSKGG